MNAIGISMYRFEDLKFWDGDCGTSLLRTLPETGH